MIEEWKKSFAVGFVALAVLSALAMLNILLGPDNETLARILTIGILGVAAAPWASAQLAQLRARQHVFAARDQADGKVIYLMPRGRTARRRRPLRWALLAITVLGLSVFAGLYWWGSYDQQQFADYSLVTCTDAIDRAVKIAGMVVGDTEHQAVQRPDGSIVTLQGMRSCSTTLRRHPPSLAETEEDHGALQRGEAVLAYQHAVQQGIAEQRQHPTRW